MAYDPNINIFNKPARDKLRFEHRARMGIRDPGQASCWSSSSADGSLPGSSEEGPLPAPTTQVLSFPHPSDTAASVQLLTNRTFNAGRLTTVIIRLISIHPSFLLDTTALS